MKRLLLAIMLVMTTVSQAQDLPGYAIFNQKGKSVNFGKMIKQLQQADIILFGELHNDAVVHWLELQVLKAIHAKSEVVVGAEMFESDDQVILDEYMAGTIKHSHFTTEAKIWKNYATDYKPLVDYAKENEIPFVATNIPRRYASLVSREGLQALDKLSDEAKGWIAPLPIQVDIGLPGYRWMIETMGSHSPGDPADMARSQASKDATMAHFITNNLVPGSKFLHYHGTFHSNNFEGIYYYLTRKNPELKIMTIASVNQSSLDKLESENLGLASFVLVVPEDSPKTY